MRCILQLVATSRESVKPQLSVALALSFFDEFQVTPLQGTKQVLSVLRSKLPLEHPLQKSWPKSVHPLIQATLSHPRNVLLAADFTQQFITADVLKDPKATSQTCEDLILKLQLHPEFISEQTLAKSTQAAAAAAAATSAALIKDSTLSRNCSAATSVDVTSLIPTSGIQTVHQTSDTSSAPQYPPSPSLQTSVSSTGPITGSISPMSMVGQVSHLPFASPSLPQPQPQPQSLIPGISFATSLKHHMWHRTRELMSQLFGSNSQIALEYVVWERALEISLQEAYNRVCGDLAVRRPLTPADLEALKVRCKGQGQVSNGFLWLTDAAFSSIYDWFAAALDTILVLGPLWSQCDQTGAPLVHGFVSRDLTEQALTAMPVGRFVIRFSDGQPGSLSVHFVQPGPTFHHPTSVEALRITVTHQHPTHKFEIGGILMQNLPESILKYAPLGSTFSGVAKDIAFGPSQMNFAD